jgi:O-methyltransferase involved in polyketide biosynthesis
MLPGSILDDSWLGDVQKAGAPWLFLGEAAFCYLPKAEAMRTLQRIAANFPGAGIVMDTTATLPDPAKPRQRASAHLPLSGQPLWVCDGPAVLENWIPALRLRQSLTLLDAEEAALRALPLRYRLPLRLAPTLMRRHFRGYRINLLQVVKPGVLP